MVSLALLALLGSAPAFAGCTAPVPDIVIPDGATATRTAMIAAQRAVRAYNTAVRDYARCLQRDLVSKIAAGGDQLKLQLKLQAEYDKMNSDAVGELQKLAGKFNQELRVFKARNAG